MSETKNAYKSLSGKLSGRDVLEDRNLESSMLLERNVRKRGVSVWS
jgi:hypothetical protein